MKKRDALSLGAEPGGGIDEANTGGTAARKRAIEVVHGKTDVMNAGTALGDELADRRISGLRLEQFDQRISSLQAGDAGSISIVEGNVRQAKDISIEWQDPAERVNGDAHVGNACWARWFVGHGECAGVVCAGV